MTQLVYLNVLISLYEFNIWLDGYIWWKFCVNSPLRNPLTDKNADVSNTYFPRCNSCLSLFGFRVKYDLDKISTGFLRVTVEKLSITHYTTQNHTLPDFNLHPITTNFLEDMFDILRRMESTSEARGVRYISSAIISKLLF